MAFHSEEEVAIPSLTGVWMELPRFTNPKEENVMTTRKKVARRKLSLLKLAAELGNVGKVYKVMGYSRQQFYEIRRNFQTYGAGGLLDRLPEPEVPHPNRADECVESTIWDYSLAFPLS
jgi:hypothetical protein